ncbi:hypothetical protein QNO07_12170 [Streptomyces sp. 549]|uniref:hypothetical protein n=1 Tax=Streptomyces sp. 549 TaxID=3049076 RepID=UPI0024C36DCF|nr:hypothetical protein [Streptomyces sp. 549]MDK1474162.1 hypothetical protein [Streptomyces sp. 549]
MVSHFGAIGLEVSSREEYEDLLRRLYALGASDDAGGGATRTVWTGSGGARVEMEVNGEGALTHVLPCLVPGGRPVPVRGIALASDGTAHMELLDAPGGESVCPLPVELTDRVELRGLRSPPVEGALRLSALAEHLTVFPDEAAYEAAQADREMKFASHYLVPAGLFRPDDAEAGWLPTAHALFAGEVVAVRRTESDLTGEVFHRLRVRTLADTEIDVAAADVQLDHRRPAVGNWVDGSFFLTGTLGLGTAPVPDASTPAE